MWKVTSPITMNNGDWHIYRNTINGSVSYQLQRGDEIMGYYVSHDKAKEGYIKILGIK